MADEMMAKLKEKKLRIRSKEGKKLKRGYIKKLVGMIDKQFNSKEFHK